MQIVIDSSTVWLDEEAHSLLERLKSTMTTEEVEEWLHSWFSSVVIPALMNEEEIVTTDDPRSL